MSESHSTKATKPAKPERPEGSPLFWHPSGRWCKKVLGKQHYFGRGTHEEALAEYLKVKDDLHSGKVPREDPEGLSVYVLCGKFLTAKKEQRDSGELSPRTFMEYAELCKRLIKTFGRNRLVADLSPNDFARLRSEMAKTWGPVRLGAEVVRARVPFNWAYDEKLLDREIVFGGRFKKPSAKTMRKAKEAKGPRMFEASEIRAMLDAAGQPLKAMILLGINCGFSNSDIGALPIQALDLENGWATFARVKTAIGRRCPLWPETVAALREWLVIRPEPRDAENSGLVFITSRGGTWSKLGDNPLSKEVRKLLDRIGINGSRSYYHLRHTMQTIGDESLDFVAVRAIMGHASNDVASFYRERMSDKRLQLVVGTVRDWLFAAEQEQPDVIPIAKANA